MRIAAPLALAAILPSVSAWGFLGHKTVALLASRYFLPETAIFVRTYLYADQTIMDAAVWADGYAHSPLGRYSKTWHYIDAKDTPPTECKVNYIRDCDGKSGCIVSAIVNMTERVTDETLVWFQRSQALKFLIHFLGDIHQPLHTEEKLKGGNGIPVLYHRAHTNLHSVWDSRIIEESEGGHTDRNVIAFANKLEERLTDGAYKELKTEWADCLNITDSETCSVSWAQDANDYICSYVLKDGIEDTDVSGEYAEGAVPIIEEMVARGAWRLAGWLNVIVTGQTGLDQETLKARVRIDSTEILTGVREEIDEMDREINEQIARWERSRENVLRVQGRSNSRMF